MNSAKRGFIFSCVLAVAATLVISSSAATIRDDAPDSAYLALGAQSDFAAVGSLVAGSFYNGSGILIAPNWVLTAAHLLLFSSTATFSISGTTYSSSAVYHDPAWNGYGTNGGDFGLVKLSTPVTNIMPATLYTGGTELGLLGTYVGFGATGTGVTGYHLPPDGNRRAFQNTIDTSFNNSAQVFGSLFINPHDPAAGTPQPLEGCVAPGDSGGGAFVQVGTQFELAGVISFVGYTNGTGNSIYGNVTGASSIPAGLPWMSSIIPDLVPEPTTIALVTTGLALGAVCLRKKRFGSMRH